MMSSVMRSGASTCAIITNEEIGHPASSTASLRSFASRERIASPKRVMAAARSFIDRRDHAPLVERAPCRKDRGIDLRRRYAGNGIDRGFVGRVLDRELGTFALDESAIDITRVFQKPAPNVRNSELFFAFEITYIVWPGQSRAQGQRRPAILAASHHLRNTDSMTAPKSHIPSRQPSGGN